MPLLTRLFGGTDSRIKKARAEAEAVAVAAEREGSAGDFEREKPEGRENAMCAVLACATVLREGLDE